MSASTTSIARRRDHLDILSAPRELSPEHRDTITATLPVIGENIDEIAKVFYRRLFAAHPELEKDLFNRGNQKQGTQQRALAASIATFAAHLVDGHSPVDLLSRIGHKHASLGITEPQYQVVHDHLFAAIVEVLGGAVTEDVAAAWDEVYWILADTLMGFETALYEDAGVEPGDVFRRAVIEDRDDATDTVAVFRLVAADGGSLPPARPGQYITVGVTLSDGARQLRQYSIMGDGPESDRASESGSWRIGVRRVDAIDSTPAGEVSSWLHAHGLPGTELDVTLPFGDLTLDAAGIAETDGESADTPVVLCSAGVGITPMLGILSELVALRSRREVTVLHADRSPAGHVLATEVAQAGDALDSAVIHTWYERDAEASQGPGEVRAGFMDLGSTGLADSLARAGAHVFLCGGTGFVRAQRDALLAAGTEPSRIHAELFSPNDWLV